MTNNIATVSIIIPVYNVEKYLRECIDSITAQTFANLEIILVNDGSSDNSPAICDEYAKKDKRIIVVHKQNGGVAAARNSGIRIATGDYVTFVDSDDWLSPNAIERIITIQHKYNVDCVRMGYCNNDGQREQVAKIKIQNGVYRKQLFPKLIEHFIAGKEPCNPWILTINRRVLLKTNLFDEELLFFEDYCLYFELFSKINSIYITNEPIYHYRYITSGLSKSSNNYFNNMKASLIAHEKIKAILSKNDLYTEKVSKIADISHAISSSNYLFLIYKNNPGNSDALTRMFTFLNNDQRYKQITQNIGNKDMPYHMRTTIKYTQNGDLESLIKFFKKRVIASKIKDLIKGPR